MKIELRSLGKDFGPIRALCAVDLTIESGSAIALIGPNGSGKSTLIRAIVGSISCTGEVLFDGEPPDRASGPRLSYVPQIAPAMAAPVGELVRFVCSVRGASARDVAAAGSALDLDVGGLEKTPFKNLSGGTRQKVLLALALASPAELYVLDEPTASLDTASRAAFFRAFRERRGGATVLLCSHRIEELRHLVDRVIVLREGRVSHDGPADRLLEELADHAGREREVLATRDLDRVELASLEVSNG